jgi:sensor histidine kinase YesM
MAQLLTIHDSHQLQNHIQPMMTLVSMPSYEPILMLVADVVFVVVVMMMKVMSRYSLD